MPRILALGAPGAGKGTQARVITEDLGIPVIATGVLLRRSGTAETPLGRKVKACMNSGALVPDELVIALVEERLSEKDAENGWLLDGFPRTVAQADALGTMLASRGEALDRVFLLDVPEEILRRRIAGRRVCPVCGRTYQIDTMPPAKQGVCDNDGETLITRGDDDAHTVTSRLKTYHEQTEPLIAYYQDKGLLTRLDGTLDPDALEIVIRQTLGM